MLTEKQINSILRKKLLGSYKYSREVGNIINPYDSSLISSDKTDAFYDKLMENKYNNQGIKCLSVEFSLKQGVSVANIIKKYFKTTLFSMLSGKPTELIKTGSKNGYYAAGVKNLCILEILVQKNGLATVTAHAKGIFGKHACKKGIKKFKKYLLRHT